MKILIYTLYPSIQSYISNLRGNLYMYYGWEGGLTGVMAGPVVPLYFLTEKSERPYITLALRQPPWPLRSTSFFIGSDFLPVFCPIWHTFWHVILPESYTPNTAHPTAVSHRIKKTMLVRQSCPNCYRWSLPVSASLFVLARCFTTA